jgi:uncharacterized protein YndB with AHSA1/START domain
MKRLLVAALASSLIFVSARAEIVESSDAHYVLRHEGTSPLAPEALWARFVEPASWWHPDHTYSGDAGNLSLAPRAGGLWLEQWEGGSVIHGSVLYVENGKSMRLYAPFGPLQGLGVYTVWTITVSPEGSGSKVVFDEISSGPPSADLGEVAKAVDYVKTEAMTRLTAD